MLISRGTVVSARVARTYIHSLTTPTFARLRPSPHSSVRHLHEYYLVDKPKPNAGDVEKPKRFQGPEYIKKKYNFMKEFITNSPLMDEEWGTLNDDFGEDFNDEPPEIFWEYYRKEMEERLYFKKQIYDMPDLKKFQKPYVPPTSAQVLCFETHYDPGATDSIEQRTVRMSVNVGALNLNPKELHKFFLLAGGKYDPATHTFSMSADRYQYPAQNKKWLSDVMDDLLKEAKDMTDDFSDIPLDRQAVRYKVVRTIPESWKRPQPTIAEAASPV